VVAGHRGSRQGLPQILAFFHGLVI
jgi:hypothetical protein